MMMIIVIIKHVESNLLGKKEIDSTLIDYKMIFSNNYQRATEQSNKQRLEFAKSYNQDDSIFSFCF